MCRGHRYFSASFLGLTQLFVTCSMAKRETVWYHEASRYILCVCAHDCGNSRTQNHTKSEVVPVNFPHVSSHLGMMISCTEF